MNITLIIFLTIIIIIFMVLICNRKSYFENTPYPIDIVYTWGGENNNNDNIRESYNNELQFSLRSVFEYMPWFNKIYIIINTPLEKNKPSWFNEKYRDKIVLLDQKDIFPKDKHHLLPCKDSNIIESYLSYIPNLEEHFIYMNDDFIINSDISWDLFYDLDKILLHKNVKYYNKLNFNTEMNFINYPYTYKYNKYHPHIPYAFTKTTYNNFLNEYSEWISWIRNSDYKKRLNIDKCHDYGLHKPCQQLHYPYRIYLYINNLGKISNNLYDIYLFGDNNFFLPIQIYYFNILYKAPFLTINNINKDSKNIIYMFLSKKFSRKLYFEK